MRLIYLDGSGCYGMNGHEDAAADAAILSRAVGRPVRVQWSREDEHGWDPKGPPQLLDITGAVDADGRILEWRTEMWTAANNAGIDQHPAARRRRRPGSTTSSDFSLVRSGKTAIRLMRRTTSRSSCIG